MSEIECERERERERETEKGRGRQRKRERRRAKNCENLWNWYTSSPDEDQIHPLAISVRMINMIILQ